MVEFIGVKEKEKNGQKGVTCVTKSGWLYSRNGRRQAPMGFRSACQRHPHISFVLWGEKNYLFFFFYILLLLSRI